MKLKHPHLSADIMINPASEFAQSAANEIAGLIKTFTQKQIYIGLSGGSTPAPVYSILGDLIYSAPQKNSITWLQIDERLVSPDSSRSNQRMIKERIFSKHPSYTKSFVSFPVSHLSSAQNISDHMPQEYSIANELSISILGIGQDGHTASLFPETAWKEAGENNGYAIVKPSSQPEARVTLSLSKLLLSKKLLFLVSGEQKQDILERILIDQEKLPTTELCQNRETIWIISDNAVSERLKKFLTE
jgi:6-phosphogluconolactonase